MNIPAENNSSADKKEEQSHIIKIRHEYIRVISIITGT